MLRTTFAVAALGAVVACGGFGSDDEEDNPPPPADPDAGLINGQPADRSITIEVQKRVSIAQRATLEIPILVKRGNALTCVPVLELKNLPAGIVASTPTIPADASKGTLTFAATDSAAQGAFEATVEATCAGERASAPIGIDVRGYPGAIDPTFGENGTVTYPPTMGGDYFASSMFVTSKLGIRLHGGYGGPTITGFDENGAIDKDFGANGVANAFNAEQAIAQGDSILLVSGTLNVRRLAANGAPDLTFGGQNGRTITIPNADVNASERRIAVGPNNEVYASVHRSLDGTVTIAKLTANGEPVTTWGNQGIVTDSWTSYVRGRALAVRPNGNVLMVGTHGNAGTAGYGFLALDGATGNLDTAFGSGKGAFPLFNAASNSQVSLLPDGAVVFSVASQQTVKLAANGTHDPTFDGDGIVTTGGGGVVTEPNGNVLVAGSKLARFLPDGKPDPSFGTGGIAPSINSPGFVALYGPDRFIVCAYKTSKQVTLTRYWR